MKNFTLASLLLFYLLSIQIYGQNKVVVDSLQKILETDISDIEKVDTWNLLAREYGNRDSLKAFEYANRAIQLAEEIAYSNGLSSAYFQLAWAIMAKKNFIKAQPLYDKALQIAQEAKYLKGMADAYNGKAIIHHYQGDFPKAIEYFLKSLKIKEEGGG